MNGFIRLIFSAVVISTFLLAPMTLIAGEWSKDQTEVLNAVNAYMEMMMKRDLEGFMKYIHDDYKGWDYETPVPYGLQTVRKWASFSFPRTEILIYEIKPLEIVVFGESAVIHYYSYYRFKDHEGKEKSYTDRWTDILTKKDGKWLLIADHGGSAK